MKSTRTRATAARLLAVAAALALGSGTVAAAEEEPRSIGWSFGLLAGPTWVDPELANYQWDVSARMGWGAQGLATLGRLGAGVRFWSHRTTQSTGLSNASDVTVQNTSWDLVVQGRVARVLGTEVFATGTAGRLYLSFDPDLIEVPGSGSGLPLIVELKPIHEWTGGAGLAFRRSLAGPVGAGLQVDHRIFGLDTAHRNGGAIEMRRQTFGDWSARLELAWNHRGH